MIRCKPKGICSWDFFLDGHGHRPTLQFNWLDKHGTIIGDALSSDVRKHGVFSGH